MLLVTRRVKELYFLLEEVRDADSLTGEGYLIEPLIVGPAQDLQLLSTSSAPDVSTIHDDPPSPHLHGLINEKTTQVRRRSSR
jgi:hypothetical protein